MPGRVPSFRLIDYMELPRIITGQGVSKELRCRVMAQKFQKTARMANILHMLGVQAGVLVEFQLQARVIRRLLRASYQEGTAAQ